LARLPWCDIFTFGNLNALSQDLLRDTNTVERLRGRPADISGSAFLLLAMPQIIEDYFALLLKNNTKILDPFEQ
jgi:hypothetical protein